MKQYWIQVFNQRLLGNLVDEALVADLLEVNFRSLCAQYGLDPAFIPSARSHLELISSPEGVVPFFALQYQPQNGVPLVIYRWDAAGEAGARWLREAQKQDDHTLVKNHLAQVRDILAISLRAPQLEDLGLLLAYEVARWGADKGTGLIFGLDGSWYRLNRHQAFIPIEKETQG